MKKLILLTLITCCIMNLNAQIRLVEVTPSANEIQIKNFGGATVNIASYRLCIRIGYFPNPLSSPLWNVVSGSLNLTAGSTVVMNGVNLNNTTSDVALYLPSGLFTDPAAMVDFMQYGGGPFLGRELTAQSAGIWTVGDYVMGNEPYTYIGNGSQNGVAFWQPNTSPVSNFIANKLSVCGADTVTFTDATTGIVTTWAWNFGSGASPATASTQGPHEVTYSTNGQKTVSLAVTGPDGNDNITKVNYINVDTTLVVNITGPLDVCSGDSISLDAGSGFTTYLWSTGATTQTLVVGSAGTYWVDVMSAACVGSDTVTVNEDTALVSVTITPQNPEICTLDSIQLDAGSHSAYYWSNCDSTQTIFAIGGGDWWVQVWDGGVCTNADTVNVIEHPTPIVDIGPDTSLLANDTILLDATTPNSTYLWSTGETTPSILYIASGVADSVSVIVTQNTGCVGEDQILIGVAIGLRVLGPGRTLEISPNPALNILSVRGDKGQLLIFNMLGKLQLEVTHKKISVLDLSSWESGFYVVQLKGSHGTLSRKLILGKK